jgi:hypothetical protein
MPIQFACPPKATEKYMRVIGLSQNEFALKEGRASGTAMGAVIIIIGIIYFKMDRSIYWVALAFIVVGLAWILSRRSITIRASRTSGRVFFQKKWLLGCRNSSYAIDDVLRVEARKQWRIAGPATGSYKVPLKLVLVYKSYIIFKDGRDLPIDYRNDSSSMSVKFARLPGGKPIAKYLATFLHVPFQEKAQPSN